MGTLLYLPDKKEDLYSKIFTNSISCFEKNGEQILEIEQSISIDSFKKYIEKNKIIEAAEELSFLFGLSFSESHDATLSFLNSIPLFQKKDKICELLDAIKDDNVGLSYSILKKNFNLKDKNILTTLQHLKAQI